MSKLCLGTLLTAIKKCAIKEGFVQSRVYSEMFSFLGYEKDMDDSFIGHIVRGAKNPPLEMLDNINNLYPEEYSKIISCFDGVSSRIDASKIALFGKIIKKIADGDTEISDETKVDLVNGTAKKDLPGNLDNLSSFIAGIYIYVIKYTDNKNKTKYVKEIDDRFLAEILSEINDNAPEKSRVPNGNIEEKDEIAAKSFLIKHENEKELIPLCQIAFSYKPLHQHVRSMYTEYNVLPYSARKYILEQCKAEILIDEDLHYSEGLQWFIQDLNIYKLSSDRYVYMFNQYLNRALEYYSECKIDKYDTCSFIRLYVHENSYRKMNASSNLYQYIDDYLRMREINIDTDALKPMDYLWYKENFESCDEETLTFWLCRFVIDVCGNLFYRKKPIKFDRKNQ